MPNPDLKQNKQKGEINDYNHALLLFDLEDDTLYIWFAGINRIILLS